MLEGVYGGCILVGKCTVSGVRKQFEKPLYAEKQTGHKWLDSALALYKGENVRHASGHSGERWTMRAWFLGLSILLAVGCSSKSLEGDTGDVLLPGSTTDGGSNDADGSTDDADGSDDTGAPDTGGTVGADDTGETGDTGTVEPLFGFDLDVAAAIAGTPVGFSVFMTDGDEITAISGYSITSDLVDDVPVD